MILNILSNLKSICR